MHLLLADDHTLFRDALIQFLARHRPDITVTPAKDYDEAARLMAEEKDISLAILDLCMPGMNGLEGLSHFRKNWPDIPVAIISGIAEMNDVKDVLDHGAIGFFPKTLSGQALIRAIELTLAGERFNPVDYTPPPPYKSDARKPPELPHASAIRLTPREQDVLRHLLTGAPNQEIATALGLQEVTIKLHVRGICQKLGAKNRTQAALIAKDIGLLPSSNHA